MNGTGQGASPPDNSNELVTSDAPPSQDPAVELPMVLERMGQTYRSNPILAVRGQAFINILHQYVASQLNARLTRFARRRGIKVRSEATILGSTKPKNVDIEVIDPENGPLVLIGVRSQMSSVGKNVLTYYEGIVGECISLQQRFPMSTHAYIYLHPLTSIKTGKENESIDHPRYARMYAAITGRTGVDYKNQRGVYDQFAYMVVDFEEQPPELRDDIILAAVPNLDMSIHTFIDRTVDTFKSRLLFWDIFD